MSNRDASDSMNGYHYQRIWAIKILLDNYDTIKNILEEGNEDIDIEYENGDKEVIQIKYHRINKPESLTKDAGLMKVLSSIATLENKQIKQIKYISYMPNKNIYNENLKIAFDNKKYDNIGKYILLLKSDNKCKTINIINNDSKLNDMYDANIKQIEIYKYLDTIEKRNMFFSKVLLEDGLSYVELNKNIIESIKNKYSEFVLNDNSTILIKASMIINKMYIYFCDKMFEYDTHRRNERKCAIQDIKNEITHMISICTNPQTLIHELLQSYDKIMDNNNISENNDIINNINNIIGNNIKYNIEWIKWICKKMNAPYKQNINYEKLNNIIINLLHNIPRIYTHINEIKKYYNILSHIIKFKKTDKSYSYPTTNIINIITGKQLKFIKIKI